MAIRRVLSFGLEVNMEHWLRKPLTTSEVAQALEQIQDQHPLKDLLIEELFPSLQVFHNQLNFLRLKKEIWSSKDLQRTATLKSQSTQLYEKK